MLVADQLLFGSYLIDYCTFIKKRLTYGFQAEEITLTIGQAFDLAYKKFLDTSRGDMDQRKNYLLLQKKVCTFLVLVL